MSTVQVFDPPMGCATGVCGPEVDSRLVQFAADLDRVATRGVTIRRFNLAQEPTSFAENAAVKAMLDPSNGDALPAIVVDGVVVASGRYPTRDELAAMVGLSADAMRDVIRIGEAVKETAAKSIFGPAERMWLRR